MALDVHTKCKNAIFILKMWYKEWNIVGLKPFQNMASFACKLSSFYYWNNINYYSCMYILLIKDIKNWG